MKRGVYIYAFLIVIAFVLVVIFVSKVASYVEWREEREEKRLNREMEYYIYRPFFGVDTNGVHSISLNITNKVVALTFDIGNLSKAKYILDVLDREAVKATIFLANNKSYLPKQKLSNRVIYYRTLEESKEFHLFGDIIRRMVEDGHLVGNHTWDHPYLALGLSIDLKRLPYNMEFVAHELGMVAKQFKKITGRNIANIWRAPFGCIDENVKAWAIANGYYHIYWSYKTDSLDWTDRYSAKQTLDRLKQNTYPGCVVLFHLGNGLRKRRDRICYILEDYIKWLKQNGYKILTIKEMGKLNIRFTKKQLKAFMEAGIADFIIKG